MNDIIRQLQEEIEIERKKIAKCKHIFGKTKYDPETVKEGYGSVQDGAGSDPHWSYAGYKDVEKARWSRKCSVCGHVEYTYEQKTIVVGHEPYFK